MFALEAAVFVRQCLPCQDLSSRPEEIGTRLFFRQTALVSFKGRIYESVNLDAFIGVSYRFQRVWFWGWAYIYCYGEELADFADLRLERILCLSSTVSLDIT